MNQCSQQACDGFTHKTLMGNWFEERQVKKQPFRDITQRTLREKDACIGSFAETGMILPLRRLSRNQPWDSSEIVTTSNWRETATSNSIQYEAKVLEQYAQSGDCRNILKKQDIPREFPLANPVSMITAKSNNYHIINRHSLRTIQKEHIENHTAGTFKSALPAFTQDYNKFLGITKYQTDFSKPLGDKPQDLVSQQSKQQVLPAGVSNVEASRRPSVQRKRLLSVQTGETFLQNPTDPKYNTFQQRSWIQLKNTGLTVGRDNIDKNNEILLRTSLQGDQNVNTGNQNDGFWQATNKHIDVKQYGNLTKNSLLESSKQPQQVSFQQLNQGNIQNNSNTLRITAETITTTTPNSQNMNTFVNQPNNSTPLALQTYLKNINQTLPFDTANSLPIGDGEFAGLARRTNTPGEFRKIHSDITKRQFRSFSYR